MGHTTPNYTFSSASSDGERPPEGAHVASATEEEVHFHDQSPRGRPTNCNGRTLGTLTRVQRHNQSPRGRSKYQSLDTPSSVHTFLLPITKGAHTTLIFQTFLYSISRYVIGHMTWGGAYLTLNRSSSSASSDGERPSEGAQRHSRSTFPLPISTGALHTLDTPLPPHYQSPRGRRKFTPFFFLGHPLFLLPISTGAPVIHTLLWTPPSLYTLDHYQSPRTHTLWTTLILTHYQSPAMVTLPLSACLGAFLGCRRSYAALAVSFRLGISTIRYIIEEVCEAIWKTRAPLHKPLPITELLLATSKEFYLKWNFPNCVGSIDGKHIWLKCPSNSGSIYYNYRHYYSIVLQGLADARYRYIAIDVGAYGKQSDSGVFRHSSLYQLLSSNNFNIRNAIRCGTSVCDTRGMKHIRCLVTL